MWSTQGAKVDQDGKSGGDQIEFEDEEAMIRATFEAELAKENPRLEVREMALAQGR